MFKPFTLSLLCLLCATTVLWSQTDVPPGVQFNDENYQQIPRRATQARRGAKSIPTNASVKKYAPIAGNQEGYTTCLAWAMAYALTIQEARQLDIQNKLDIQDKAAIQRLFYSPAFIYYHIKDEEDVDCKNGADILKAMNAIQLSGVVRHSDLPSNCPKLISTDLINKAYKGIAPAFNRLIEPNEAQNLNVKKALSENNPVIIVQRGEGQAMGHAMCVVGYQDDPTTPGGGYFEVLNSRGIGWQSEGYARISYKMFKEVVSYAIEVPSLLALPKTGKPAVDSMRAVQPFKSKVYLVDGDTHKMELKPALSELTRSNRGAGVGKKTQASHYIAAKPVHNEFNYQVLVDNEAAAYVYILNFDSRKVVDLLFPHNESVSAYQGKQSAITLPSDDDWIIFDDNKGYDYACILFSRKPLDMKNLKAKIETEAAKPNSAGKFPVFAKCLETVLGEQLAGIGDGSIRYDAKEHALNLNLKTDKNIAAMIIEFEHK